MNMESIAGITIVVVLALICLVFFVTRRLMRLMVRLALAGALILIVLTGGLAWWYTHEEGRDASPRQKEKPQPSRRANSR
ncbi:MAG TPA: hypothetical protein VE842_15865 [Pyrinomonadaceae bacterium]|jgi:uncharacterized membrane protein|nr:hypothetical protein [Pyrinomonadaceae bacterium]